MMKFELDDPAPMYSYVKFNFKASLCFQLFDLRTPSGGEMDLKKKKRKMFLRFDLGS